MRAHKDRARGDILSCAADQLTHRLLRLAQQGRGGNARGRARRGLGDECIE
jgi:hypothetical protein